jgi:hypothetical protein
VNPLQIKHHHGVIACCAGHESTGRGQLEPIEGVTLVFPNLKIVGIVHQWPTELLSLTKAWLVAEHIGGKLLSRR